jgi:hypothetical protein
MSTTKPSEKPDRKAKLRHKLVIGFETLTYALKNTKIERRGDRLYEVRAIALVSSGEMAALLHCTTEWIAKLGKNRVLIKATDEEGSEIHGAWYLIRSLRNYSHFMRGGFCRSDGSEPSEY